MKREERILAFEPFDGGKGDCEITLFSDRMVNARKSHTCQMCFGPILAGARVRARTEMFDGIVKTFRFCPACCDAMAVSWEDAGEAVQDRCSLGAERARQP